MADDLPSGVNPEGDNRSRKFVLVIECILNQNARIDGAAAWPAMNLELVKICEKHGAGIVQIPCPEMAALTWARPVGEGRNLLDEMRTEKGRAGCRRVAVAMADRVEDYIANGYRPLAVLAGNPKSPGCAVHFDGDDLAENSGVFIQEFFRELRDRKIDIPFRGIRDYGPEPLAEDHAWLEELLAAS
jgi:predicted secreted protein